MSSVPYLTFTLNQSLYGIPTQFVEEIFSLPELKPTPDAPDDILGVINLRGMIIPVMDLNIRFGYRAPDYSVRDTVIILHPNHQHRFGIIINDVHEVVAIDEKQISFDFTYGRETLGHTKQNYVTGLAHLEENIIILLNISKLLTHFNPEDLLHEETIHREDRKSNQDVDSREEEFSLGRSKNFADIRLFCPNATPEERQIFRQRAENLRQVAEEQDLHGRRPLAIFLLNEEFFGIDLTLVQEFADIQKVTPIPCCPPHIIGNINLRGEILTLIDICGVLNLPLMRIAEGSQVIVVDVEGLVTGIIVEAVADVIFLDQRMLSNIPTAVHSVKDEYLFGTAPYREKMISLLDLKTVLSDGSLTVEEFA